MSSPEVAMITGASAGVGRAAVREFAKRGAYLGLIARGGDGLEAARREVEEAGGRALVFPLDVADAEAVEEAAECLEQELGPIDIWINNAMVSVFSPVKEMSADEFWRVTEVTYLGVVHGTLTALRRMLPRDRGTIVQVGSALSYRSIPLQAAYCAAKHAARGFTDSLRCELIHDESKVHVTMVQMPALNTPQFGWTKSRLPRKAQPVPPIFQPEVAGAAIYWAAHQKRREVFVGLPTVEAILGNRISPGLLDHYLARTAIEGQQTTVAEDPDRLDNLFQPMVGDHGAHGTFDARSKRFSLQFWASRHRRVLSMAAAGVGALWLLLMKRDCSHR